MKKNTTINNSDIVGVCHPNWRGIKASTYALVSKVYETKEINSYSEAKRIAMEIISKYNPKKVVLSGYPNGYNLLAKAIKEKDDKIKVFFLTHTPFTWYTDKSTELSWLKDMLQAYNEGYIDKIGCIKKDVYQFFKEMDINAFFVMNRLSNFENHSHHLNKTKLQIGVWGANMWHRNLLNQVIAGLMVPGAKINVNDFPDYFFFDNTRINKHGILPKDKYLSVLRSMDINLYVSFTDCFPMTVIESMYNGIPCLISDTSEIYTWSKYLRKNLIINKIDSPVAIKKRILWIIDNYENVQKEILNYLPKLEKEIEKTINIFLK